MKAIIKLLVLVVGLLGAALHCVAPRVAGGASGTEISACVVSGAVVDSSNNPIADCLVRLRPYNYIAGKDSVLPGAMQDARTNTAGKFVLDSVPPGQYLIEITLADSLGKSIEFAVDSAESLHVLSPEKIKSLATIYGNNVPLIPQGASNSQPSVHAIGFERSAPIDSFGHFEMKVPPGWCRLQLQGIDTSRYHGDTVIYLTSGKKYNIMPPPQFMFLPCDSLSCEMKYVQEILDSNGITSLTPESVTVVESGHVSQLLLRGKALRVLPGSVCLLTRLRVLDIGRNFIRELPMGISNLRKLSALRADSNALWMVPAAIGMLFTLRELDLSYNGLMSLPGPITSLMPKVLRLDGNFLCNLGDFTAGWADFYDFGWRERQYCW